MKVLLLVSLAFNILFFIYIRSLVKENKKLVAEKPVLDLKTFEKVYDTHIATYGEGVAEIIIRTCLATAHALKSEVVIHKEMHEEMDACTQYVKEYTARITEAEEKLEGRLKHLHKSHQTKIAMLRTHQEADRTRIDKIRELHRLI